MIEGERSGRASTVCECWAVPPFTSWLWGVVHRRNTGKSCRCIWCRAASALPSGRARHTQSIGHPDQLAVQRCGDTWGALSLLATAADRGNSHPRLDLGNVAGRRNRVVIRVELLPGAQAFDAVIAAVLVPMGAWLLVSRPKMSSGRGWATRLTGSFLTLIAGAVGCVGGIYGIGGGSILAPILIGSGRSPHEVAPATLASTFVTSLAGVVTFLILSSHHHGSVAPDWGVGIALGIGGLLGGYTGARLQPHLPETVIRRLLGLLVLGIGIRYAWLAS